MRAASYPALACILVAFDETPEPPATVQLRPVRIQTVMFTTPRQVLIHLGTIQACH